MLELVTLRLISHTKLAWSACGYYKMALYSIVVNINEMTTTNANNHRIRTKYSAKFCCKQFQQMTAISLIYTLLSVFSKCVQMLMNAPLLVKITIHIHQTLSNITQYYGFKLEKSKRRNIAG